MAAGQWELRISEVLVKFGVTKEKLQENAAEELESTLQDYHVQYNHTHCHWCGKKMGWDGNQRKGGKGLNVPKMKRQSGVG